MGEHLQGALVAIVQILKHHQHRLDSGSITQETGDSLHQAVTLLLRIAHDRSFTFSLSLISDTMRATSAAPVLTLWAAVVAEVLGFEHDETLPLGRAVAGLNAYSKGVSLGLFQPTPREVEELPGKAYTL